MKQKEGKSGTESWDLNKPLDFRLNQMEPGGMSIPTQGQSQKFSLFWEESRDYEKNI